MIELVNSFIVGTDQAELEALQVLLLEFSSDFTFSIESQPDEVIPYKMVVGVNDTSTNLVMDSFLEFLTAKIEQVNQQFS